MTAPEPGSGPDRPPGPHAGPPPTEPYTGPPPTGPYGAPPVVPGTPQPWQAGGYPGPRGQGGYPPAPGAPPPASGPPQPRPPQPWPPQPWAPPPGMRWAPPPGTPPHDVPRPYLLIMRSRDWRWWRPLLGLLLFGVVFSVADVIVVLAAVFTGVGPDLALQDLTDPAVLLMTNLTLIVAIPSVWLAWAVAHGMGIGWSSSVLGRLRWRLFVPWTLRALATLGVGIAVPVVIGAAVDPGAITGPVRGFGWLLLVVLFTTPLQSAAEEYFFRGYLSQAIAAWIRAPRAGAVIAAVITAALFSAAHVPPDLITFADRFAFGLAASAVVWLTGGLEAAIVLHAVNNVLVFVLAGALGEGIAADEVPSGAGPLVVALDLLAMAAYVLLVARARRRLKPETCTPALDLRTPPPAYAYGPPPAYPYGPPVAQPYPAPAPPQARPIPPQEPRPGRPPQEPPPATPRGW